MVQIRSRAALLRSVSSIHILGETLPKFPIFQYVHTFPSIFRSFSSFSGQKHAFFGRNHRNFAGKTEISFSSNLNQIPFRKFEYRGISLEISFPVLGILVQIEKVNPVTQATVPSPLTIVGSSASHPNICKSVWKVTSRC